MTVHDFSGFKKNKALDDIGFEIEMGLQAQALGRDQNEVIRKMRAIPRATVQAYRETDYLCNVDGEFVTLKVGKPTPAPLNARVRRLNVPEWALVSAWNPGSRRIPESENRQRQQLLQDLLDHHGYESFSATGRSPDRAWAEPGFLVPGISYELAKAFGSCFQQHAVLFGEVDGPVELLFCDKESDPCPEETKVQQVLKNWESLLPSLDLSVDETLLIRRALDADSGLQPLERRIQDWGDIFHMLDLDDHEKAHYLKCKGDGLELSGIIALMRTRGFPL